MGRPKKNVNAEFAISVEEAPETVAPVIPDLEARRQQRQPLNGRTLKLQVFGEVPGYHLYIAKDEGARIALMQQAGYEFVKHDEVSVRGSVASYNTDPGGHVRFVLGSNGPDPLYGYLMKIPLEFYEEDQAALEAANASVDDQIRAGNLKETPDEQRYIPKGGIKYQPKTAVHFKTRPQ